ncbi:beta-galactosidase 7-like [Zingiber officinale]|uniref:beta-galactosidase 7-like n=1 Tax=Zingiber officinale TaxID=94328 RepID=UPI001C4D4099|nr:beta-galactosidase 7-like [Zingiber officinale]
MLAALKKVFFFLFFLVSTWMIATAAEGNAGVTYDGRSLIINGTRRLLFSGSIHYPRSTPQMWPSLIAKAKEGGLDVIQTCVFWNVHEPVQGQYNFSGRFDLVRFIKEVQSQGLYVSLRIGPFIQAEWSYGGLPFWLHDVPDIVFRSDNEPFKFHMRKYVTKIVDLMKSEKLFASQGGPIIISQIENEYKTVEAAFHEKGPLYVNWTASMAVGLQTGVPWMMCKQDDAPDPVINACNGLNCGLTFAGPNSPKKPAIWTENWTFKYQVYGKNPRPRSAQDIAFAVALFIAKKNGSFVNYYMYHGGTNFGKSASSYVTTAYYDQAPLDEYGLIWKPTWGHLRDLHAVIKQSEDALLWGVYSNSSLGQQQEAHVFQTNSGQCVAFLVNYDKHDSATLHFRGATYDLSARSINVLPNCKDVAFDTAKVSAQTRERSATPIQYLSQDQQWQAFADEVISQNKSSFTAKELKEQMSLIKDATDYLWYTISYNHSQHDGPQTLHVGSRAHVLHVFINGKLVGTVHGDHDGALPNFEQPIEFREGWNDISLLSVMVGLPDSGPYLERRVAGLRRVRIQGSGGSLRDLRNWLWHYKVGLTGESMLIFSEQGSETAEWKSLQGYTNKPLMWYKTRFDAPKGDDPVVLNLENMGKGEVWINGESIGRYWASFKAPSGDPTQALYHIPRSFLKPSANLLVLFEELGGDPRSIGVETMSIFRVCGHVSELHYPSVLSKNKDPYALLQCPQGRNISMIEFASYGTPLGECLAYPNIGNCHAPESEAIIKKACLGKQECTILVTDEMFGGDPCVGTRKSLLVFGRCS